MATLTLPASPPDPTDDAAQLHRAFKGLGCDTAVVVNLLCHRDATQRAFIIQEYKTMYSKDFLTKLVEKLILKFEVNLQIAMLVWMPDPPGRDAMVIKQSFMLGNLEAAIEVICSRTPTQIQAIREPYHSKYGVPLDHEIGTNTSGDLKKLLLAYIGIVRDEGIEFDREIVRKDAEALYKAGEKRSGTDEGTFIRIFSERSRTHLAAVDTAYDSMYGNGLRKAVKRAISGKVKTALLTILVCAENPAKYFAKVLRKSMKGLGTNNHALTRVIVTRAEIDMQYIKAEYYMKYKMTLNDAVHSDTSGHYRTFLLSLLGPNE